MRAAHDVVIRGGTVYDGSGGAARDGDVAVDGDRVAAIGTLVEHGRVELDATGLVVAPGFINMLSWATNTLVADGRSQSDIRQGVTTEIFGEGWSLGPLNEEMRRDRIEAQGDIKFPIEWTTLAEALDWMVARGVAPNIASFVGATTIRIHELGENDRPPTADELTRMRALVDRAMRDGALGLGSALIYAPATYADTDELVALCEIAARHGGMYISHMRSEGDRLIEAIDELITIARRARLPAEIYHLKQAGRRNWKKLDAAIERVESARAAGLRITADMYPYEAGATGLPACFPPWVQDGGQRAMIARLRDEAHRARVRDEMARPGTDWENLYEAAGTPDRIVLVTFKSERLKPFTGRTLADVARERGRDPRDVAMDLVIEDDSRVGMVVFMADPENVRREVALPWMSFGSDAGSLAPEGVFLRSQPHPRAYGTFARVLGRFVRDERAAPLEDVIHRLTGFPAANLKLDRRGLLLPGYFADLVVFDPARIQDHATYTDPQRYATGVAHVIVNGEVVLRDGEHTGALPGRVLHGPARRDG
ncbi:MAG TPA: D-aminoacylase [Candidatus Limnocylindria bacterium]|nr:D-aminoacylase [Candidatus Limnocylindria bacterium]